VLHTFAFDVYVVDLPTFTHVYVYVYIHGTFCLDLVSFGYVCCILPGYAFICSPTFSTFDLRVFALCVLVTLFRYVPVRCCYVRIYVFLAFVLLVYVRLRCFYMLIYPVRLRRLPFPSRSLFTLFGYVVTLSFVAFCPGALPLFGLRFVCCTLRFRFALCRCRCVFPFVALRCCWVVPRLDFPYYVVPGTLPHVWIYVTLPLRYVVTLRLRLLLPRYVWFHFHAHAPRLHWLCRLRFLVSSTHVYAFSTRLRLLLRARLLDHVYVALLFHCCCCFPLHTLPAFGLTFYVCRLPHIPILRVSFTRLFTVVAVYAFT